MGNDHIFVIAGNHSEFSAYRSRRCDEVSQQGGTISYSNFVYVYGPEVLRGFDEVHGVFIGTWRSRSDIKEIVETLLKCCYRNPALEKIHQELWSAAIATSN